MNLIKKSFIYLLQKTGALSALSCRLTKLTGKSSFNIHPKHLVKTRKPWFLKYIDKKDMVLDVGCGNGEHSFKIARVCKEVTAFDIEESKLQEAKRKQKQRKIKNIKFLKIDANKKLPFKRDSFDLILCQDVLEHVRDYKKTTKEVLRVLRNRGLFLVTLPNKETSWKRLKKQAGQFWFADKGHIREWSLKEIDNFGKEFNLKLLDKRAVVYDTPLIGFIDLIGGISLSLYQRLLAWKKKKALESPEESTGFSLVLRKR